MERKDSNGCVDRLPTAEYRRVFQQYYARLCAVLPAHEILPSLLSSEIITMDEMEEIEAKETSSLKAHALLKGPIWRAINGGFPVTFVRLLCLMRLLRVRSCEELAEEIRASLSISSKSILEASREYQHNNCFKLFCMLLQYQQ